MSYPTGVETVTLTYGRSIRPDGTELATTLTITPIFTGTKTATWAATGTSLIPVTLTLSAAEGVMGTVELPIVDQPGWVDDAQNGYTGWTYKIIEAVQGVAQNRVKYFSPILGQEEVDFDMIPTGAVGTPTLGVIPPVTSVNGKTGAVVIDAPVTLSYDTEGFPVLTFHEHD